MKKIYVYYRISDKGNVKLKLPNADKFSCLINAVNEFGKENIFVTADNCNEETINFIEKIGLDYEITNLGNSKSFMYIIDRILKERGHSDYIYLLEDDYLHRKGSRKVLIEGLQLAEYVTLYDMPDKYMLSKIGGNPFNKRKLQKSRVYFTGSTHWREVNSTTMTFACKAETLGKDYKIWKDSCVKTIPCDFCAFVRITQNNLLDIFSFGPIMKAKKPFLYLCLNSIFRRKRKKLISPIPGYSTHAEIAYLSPIINWKEIDLYTPKM